MKKPQRTIRNTILLASITLAGLPGFAHAVDGVTLITQSRAFAGNVTPGDAPGFPVTISRPGSYRLASNLTVSGDAIHVTSDDVSLDLNGFAIESTGMFGPSGTGVSASSVDNTTVANGTMRNMRNAAFVGSNSRVEKIRAIGSGLFSDTIVAGDGCVIRDNMLNSGFEDSFGITAGNSCLITGNSVSNHRSGIICRTNCTIDSNVVSKNADFGPGNFGILAAAGSTILHNTVIETSDSDGEVGVVGIRLTGVFSSPVGGSLVLGNTVRGNGGVALQLSSDDGYRDNVLTGNNSGLEVQVSGGVDLGGNLCGTDTTCP